MATGHPIAARSLRVQVECWPIAGGFATARGRSADAEVVLVEVREGEHVGRGEGAPISRYGESAAAVRDDLLARRGDIEAGLPADAVRVLLPAGAGRNALESALLDLEAKRAGRSVAERLGLAPLRPLDTAYTVSLDTPEAMAEVVRRERARPLLKLKLGGPDDEARIRRCRDAAPDATLIADVNEGWTAEQLPHLAHVCAEADLRLVEQPLPAGDDAFLAGFRSPVPLYADESCHGLADLDRLAARYAGVNVKLDKTGGLLEAVALVRRARELGLEVMVGCMVGTSLGMAPAFHLGQLADRVDLDGPLLLARDRDPGLRYEGSRVFPPSPSLWG